MYSCTPVQLHTCTHVHLHTYTPSHLYNCKHAHLYICTHVHLHTCTSAHLYKCTPVRTVYVVSVNNTTNNTNALQSWCSGERRNAPAWDIQSCATMQVSPSHRQDFPYVAYNCCKCTTSNPSPPKETWCHTFVPHSLHVSQYGKAHQ